MLFILLALVELESVHGAVGEEAGVLQELDVGALDHGQAGLGVALRDALLVGPQALSLHGAFVMVIMLDVLFVTFGDFHAALVPRHLVLQNHFVTGRALMWGKIHRLLQYLLFLPSPR